MLQNKPNIDKLREELKEKNDKIGADKRPKVSDIISRGNPLHPDNKLEFKPAFMDQKFLADKKAQIENFI